MPPPAAGDAYRSGEYFGDSERHSGDAEFKAGEFAALLKRNPACRDIGTLADVGCGSGATTIAVATKMTGMGFTLSAAAGYDIAPHVDALRHPLVRFVHEDFTSGAGDFDLVTLFDVLEHVPDPVGFLRRVSRRARFLGLHIPLDDSLNCSVRDLYRRNLKDPGHLIALDTASALNLLAMAGLQVMDYEYTFAFRAPSGHATLLSKCVYPVRAAIAALSPWVLAKTLGGTSLMVLCRRTDRPIPVGDVRA